MAKTQKEKAIKKLQAEMKEEKQAEFMRYDCSHEKTSLLAELLLLSGAGRSHLNGGKLLKSASV